MPPDTSKDADESRAEVAPKQQLSQEGFDLAVRSMRLGESAMFKVKAKYAYGDVGIHPKHMSTTGMTVPPNAEIRYSIELIGIEPLAIKKTL